MASCLLFSPTLAFRFVLSTSIIVSYTRSSIKLRKDNYFFSIPCNFFAICLIMGCLQGDFFCVYLSYFCRFGQKSGVFVCVVLRCGRGEIVGTRIPGSCGSAWTGCFLWRHGALCRLMRRRHLILILGLLGLWGLLGRMAGAFVVLARRRAAG